MARSRKVRRAFMEALFAGWVVLAPSTVPLWRLTVMPPAWVLAVGEPTRWIGGSRDQ